MSIDPFAVETVELGGLPVARLDRAKTAALLGDLATTRRRADRPWFTTSVNGHVLSAAAHDRELREAIHAADLVSCDSQPLVLASRRLTGFDLPERVATTDLFHEVATLARSRPLSMFMLGGTEDENGGAASQAQQTYPHLRIIGRLHGFHDAAAWSDRVAEINELGPDLLWVGLGVPLEQRFYMKFGSQLPRVGVIKTCGGLFNFLSGSLPRASQWMQDAGFEWLYRLSREPGRLWKRYAFTNLDATRLLLTRSRRGLVVRHLTSGSGP